MLHPPFRTFNFTPSLPAPLPIPSHGTGGGLEGENGAVFCTWQSLSAAAPHTFSLLQGGLLQETNLFYHCLLHELRKNLISVKYLFPFFPLWHAVSSFPPRLCLSMILFLCLKNAFTGAPLSWPHSESITASWNWLCPAQSSPSLFSQRLPLQHHSFPVPKPCSCFLV